MPGLSPRKTRRTLAAFPADALRFGVIDTGVNTWHSHVRGRVEGCRIYPDRDGRIREDGDFRDLVGHGTAVAGIIRQHHPDAEIFAVKVFGEELTAYPSVVARGVLRAAAEGCAVINLSLGMLPAPGSELLAQACTAAIRAGCVVVAAGHPDEPKLLPASLPGVIGVVADNRLSIDEIEFYPDRPNSYAAAGLPRNLAGLPSAFNLWGNSFACARVAAHLAIKIG